jgi:hypothetical protein
MKPAPFEYQVPATLREAIDLLVSDPEATVIAGGQSLMPVTLADIIEYVLKVDAGLFSFEAANPIRSSYQGNFRAKLWRLGST